MESNDELKEIKIKNCTCYYFDDMIKSEDFNLANILIDEKSYENFLVYNTSFKTLIDSKSLRIRFDKLDGFIRVYDGIRYLVLFGRENYDQIEQDRYLLSLTSSITYVISYNCAT